MYDYPSPIVVFSLLSLLYLSYPPSHLLSHMGHRKSRAEGVSSVTPAWPVIDGTQPPNSLRDPRSLSTRCEREHAHTPGGIITHTHTHINPHKLPDKVRRRLTEESRTSEEQAG